MKYIIILSSLFIFGCNSTKLVKNPPFKILDAYYQNWYGGREGVKGIGIKIKLTNISGNVNFKNLYFKDHKLDLSVNNSGNEILLSANINTGYKPENMQMHSNPKKEYGNTLPQNKKDFPFKLKENEAVIEYAENKKTSFYKIMLNKKKDLFMP